MKKSIFLLGIIISLIGSIESCNSFSQQKIKQVAITLSTEIDSTQFVFLKKEIESLYNVRVKFIASFVLPQQAYYRPRNRFKAGLLLDYLLTIKPDTINYILGITGKDISTTTEKYSDYGIIGLAHVPGNSCIVSTFRLGNNIPETLFRDRLTKVCLHELGHNVGLAHCPNAGCIMNDAKGKVETIDNESINLCPSCRAKIASFMKEN